MFAVAIVPLGFGAGTPSDRETNQPLDGEGLDAVVVPAIELFTEVPGVRQFRGVLVARPVQAANGPRLGLATDATEAMRAAAIEELKAFEVLNHFAEVDEYLIQVPEGENENLTAARLMAGGNFEYVEPDWTVFPVGCPNDTNFSQQWHHGGSHLDSCDAWEIETGSPDIVVAICDTGLRTTHRDLLANRREGLHVPSLKWENAGGPIDDVNGHGTACSGCAAGNGNNSRGIAGVGWNLGHRTMRVTDASSGDASLSNLTLAARRAAEVGDRVASVSYSGVNSSSVNTTGAYLRGLGALLVWAAGNESAQYGGSREDSVIVVGATDTGNQLASFSNYGSLIDVVAPGVNIRTTSSSGDNNYTYISGTSFSCPITAGLCGLIWSRNPNLSPAQVEQILRDSCTDLGAAGPDDVFGYGRIDAYDAMRLTPPSNGEDTVPPPPPSSVSASAGESGISLAWTAPGVGDLDSFRVYRSSTSGLRGSLVSSSNLQATTFTDTGIQNGQTYYYVVTALDTSGNESNGSAEVSARWFVLSPFSGGTVVGETDGLHARYHEAAGLTAIPDFDALTPTLVGGVANLGFTTTTGPCVGSGLADNVAAVFEGWVEVPTSGMWLWSLTSDAGSRLYIDGELVIDHDGLHAYSEKADTVFTKAGRHGIRVEYFESTGSCGLLLRWTPPGGSKVPVPASAFTNGGTIFDLDGSGSVDAGDIGQLLLEYGQACDSATSCYGDPWGGQRLGNGPCDCPGDLDGSGEVEGGDIGILLLNFGT
jgi:subtilisin family serine protease